MNKIDVMALNKDIITNKRVNAAIGVFFFALATAFGAHVRIPLGWTPVPITLQTFFAIMSGAVLGARLGAYSQLGYLFLGISGIPVFQNSSSGALYLLGPTGGYIVGFVFASIFVGIATEKKSPAFGRSVIIFALGSLLIYLFGMIWLISLYRIPLARALYIGALPFVPGDILKIITAAIIYSKISRRAKSIFLN